MLQSYPELFTDFAGKGFVKIRVAKNIAEPFCSTSAKIRESEAAETWT